MTHPGSDRPRLSFWSGLRRYSHERPPSWRRVTARRRRRLNDPPGGFETEMFKFDETPCDVSVFKVWVAEIEWLPILARLRRDICSEKHLNLYFEAVDSVYATKAKCESEVLNSSDLLDGPVCHSGFKRLN